MQLITQGVSIIRYSFKATNAKKVKHLEATYQCFSTVGVFLY